MLLDALAAAVSDLAVGLVLGIAALFFIVAVLYLETRDNLDLPEPEDMGVELADPWDLFPPKWSPPRAKSDLEGTPERDVVR